jgi:uncharacterized lipoprotein YehR (DUF1307 family)
MKTKLTALLLAAALTLALAGCAGEPTEEHVSVRGNTVGNNINDAIAVLYGDYIYYANRNVDNLIYRIGIDGKGKTKVSNDEGGGK